ncbi:MAG: ester cyclase [Planctomycetota bacterium]
MAVSQSIKAKTHEVVLLRKRLGLTQDEAGRLSGYSDRLIRKLERNGAVRPQTLRDILQCYHESLGISDWQFDDFLDRSDSTTEPTIVNGSECPNCRLLQEYFETVYVKRQKTEIDTYCCQNIRFTGEGTSRTGIDVIHQRAEALLNAFDPIEFRFERIHSIDDIVFGFWHSKQKHVGDFFEVPATGRWVEIRGNSVAQYADGLVVDAEDHFDVESVIRQLTGQEPRVI